MDRELNEDELYRFFEQNMHKFYAIKIGDNPINLSGDYLITFVKRSISLIERWKWRPKNIESITFLKQLKYNQPARKYVIQCSFNDDTGSFISLPLYSNW